MSEKEIHPKTPQIIEMRKSGASWKTISTALDIPPRSLYALRHSEGFMEVANSIWMDLWEDIAKQRAVDSNYNLDQSIKNQMKMFMLISGTSLDAFVGEDKKSMDCDDNCAHWAMMQNQRNKEFNELFDTFITVGTIDPWQMQRFRLFMLKRPWKHITKENWDK